VTRVSFRFQVDLILYTSVFSFVPLKNRIEAGHGVLRPFAGRVLSHVSGLLSQRGMSWCLTDTK